MMEDLLRPFLGGDNQVHNNNNNNNIMRVDSSSSSKSFHINDDGEVEIMVDSLLTEIFDRLSPLLMSNDPTFQSKAFDSLQEIVETLSNDYGLNSKELYADFIIRLLIVSEEKGVNFDWDNYEEDGTEICYPVFDDDYNNNNNNNQDDELPSFFEPFLSQQQNNNNKDEEEFERCLLAEENEYNSIYNEFYYNNNNVYNEHEIGIDVVLTLLLPLLALLWLTSFLFFRKLFGGQGFNYLMNANSSSAIIEELLAEEEAKNEKEKVIISNHKRNKSKKKKRPILSSNNNNNNNNKGASKKKQQQQQPQQQPQQHKQAKMAGLEKQKMKGMRPIISEPIQTTTTAAAMEDDEDDKINNNHNVKSHDDDDEPIVVVEAIVVEDDEVDNISSNNSSTDGWDATTTSVQESPSSYRDDEDEEEEEESASMMLKGLEREDEEDETTTSNTTCGEEEEEDDDDDSEQQQQQLQQQQNQSLETMDEEENESILLRQEEDQLLEECILASLQEHEFEDTDDIIDANNNSNPSVSMVEQDMLMMKAFSIFSPTTTTTTTTSQTPLISQPTNSTPPLQLEHKDYSIKQATEQQRNNVDNNNMHQTSAANSSRKQKPKRKPKQQQKQMEKTRQQQQQQKQERQKEKETTAAVAVAADLAAAKKQRELEEQAALMLEAKRQERLEFWKPKLKVADDHIQPILHLLACEYACRNFPSCLEEEEGSRSAIDLLLEDTSRRKILETQARIGFDKLFPNECMHLRVIIATNNNNSHRQNDNNNKNSSTSSNNSSSSKNKKYNNKKQINNRTWMCNKIGIVRDWDDNTGKFLIDFSSSAAAAAAATTTKKNTSVGKRRNKNKNKNFSYFLPEQVEPLNNNSNSNNNQTIPSDSIEVELNLVPPKCWIGIDDTDSDSDNDDEHTNVTATRTIIHIERSTVMELMTSDNPNEYLDMYTQRYRDEQCLKKQIEEKERISKEKAGRVTFWAEKMEFEKLAIARIMVLLATEFCRQQKNYGAPKRSILMQDQPARKKIEVQAKQTFQELFSNEIPQRVVIRGEGGEELSKNLDGRMGTIQYWDVAKGKYCIILDTTISTKKRNNKNGGGRQQKTDEKCYVNTEFLEPLSTSSFPCASSSKKKKKQRRRDTMSTTSLAYIASLYHDESLMYEVDKSIVDTLLEQIDDDSVDKFLDAFCLKQDQIQEIAEEEERKQQEEARRHRAEKLRREEEEQKQAKQVFLERMEQIREQSRQQSQQRQIRREADAGRDSDDGFGYEAGLDTYSNQRPYSREEEYIQDLFKQFFGRQRQSVGGGESVFFHPSGDGESFFLGSGGHNFFAGFDDDYESSENDDYRWEVEFDRLREEEMAERNANAAELLGLEPDATVEEINRNFRRLGLQYHPDRYKANNHVDWMTQEQIEEKFKEVSDARDEMFLYRERGGL